MTLIEIDNNVFINLEKVFKFAIEQTETNDHYIIRFYDQQGNRAESKKFDSEDNARDWLSLRIIRAAGSNEILGLKA